MLGGTIELLAIDNVYGIDIIVWDLLLNVPLASFHHLFELL